MSDRSRRQFLQSSGALIGGGLLYTTTAVPSSASEGPTRYIVDMETMSMEEMGDVEVVYDWRDEIGYVAVECGESALPNTASYAPDMEIELDVPYEETQQIDARTAGEPFFDLQWDKQEQNISRVHRRSGTGDGARIGIIDDGVLGAGDRTIVGSLDEHPDLPNVQPDLSRNFTSDGNGPGPLNDDHGTHCAGTAAAAVNGTGVVGMAPNAEIVDLRVFSGMGASTSDIIAAVLYGSRAVGDGGAGCDVLNLSLGLPPLLPVPSDSPLLENGATAQNQHIPDPIIPVDAGLVAPIADLYGDVGAFAINNGTLPVASAGNDGVNLDTRYDAAVNGTIGEIEFDATPVVLPAEATGFMSIGATGPIGWGWSTGRSRSQPVAGIQVQDPPQPELPTQEPALYTNYGTDAVDVTAGGGNADIDAIGSVPNYLIDLVFNTGIANLTNDPEDTELDEYVPGYSFKAGTSFAAPNVAGLAALLFAIGDDPTPIEVRAVIEETAVQYPVGKSRETTAPGADVNVASDGVFDGNVPSNPGSTAGRFSSRTYRGEGHISASRAVRQIQTRRGGERSGR